MKYCTHCGSEIMDEAAICPKCGCPTENYRTAPAQRGTGNLSILSIVGFVFAFINTLVGLVCSIIAYRNAVAEGDERSRSFAKTGIIISSVIMGIGFLISVIWVVIFLGIIGTAAAGNISAVLVL